MGKAKVKKTRKKGEATASKPPVSAPSRNRAIDDRNDGGRTLRKQAPRSSHAGWSPPTDRRDPIEILIESSADRVPHLVPIRYGRMLKSPFAFFRGAAAIMAADLARTPV